jgi:hypothetical protein
MSYSVDSSAPLQSEQSQAESCLSIEQLLRQEVNPFDPNSFKPGNFWYEIQDSTLHIPSIHEEIFLQLGDTLQQVQRDRVTRSVILTGESGSGKSHLLGRLKSALNDRAFFVYVGPWADSGFIWRHILRNTVDSLLQKPAGATESQLMLWLQALLNLQDEDFARRIFGKRRSFIRTLASQHPTGLYNANEFFGVLYDLTNPEMEFLAASWLRGDNLDEESCAELRVKQPIDSEDAAQKILANFGKISVADRPIVLCFDNLDNLPHLPSGQPDFQSLFNVNSSIHNDKLQNFLILISIVTDTWKQNRPLIQPADLARVNQELSLFSINLEQAAGLWIKRLLPYHHHCDTPPPSPLAPLQFSWLETAFPGAKTLPRRVLTLGHQLIDRFKQEGGFAFAESPAAATPENRASTIAHLKILWYQELEQVKQTLTHISQLSSPDLLWRLREVLELMQVPNLKSPLLQGTKFAAYSLSFGTIGVVWVEDSHQTTFYHLMKACQKLLGRQDWDGLYLLRAEPIGRRTTKAYQLYRRIFAYANYLHIQPDLEAVQQLETYHRLLNAASGRELVVGQETPDIPTFQTLIRQAKVLQRCSLLEELGIIRPSEVVPEPEAANVQTPETPEAAGESSVREYLENLVITQQLMGLQVLIRQGCSQFSQVPETEVAAQAHHLCEQGRIYLLNPDDRPVEQLVSYRPL